jgi:[acyl-carrier-protein] S-malonyltransferase
MKRAWMFPGQGSQEVGMGGKILETAEMKSLLAKAEAITGRPIGDIMKNGPKELLDRTSNTQVAVLVVSLGAMAVYLKHRRGKEPDFVIGHSVGEVAAAVAAGSISEDDAIAFIYERGLAMEAAVYENPGGMSAILGVSYESVELTAAQNGAHLANYNIPDQQAVISGTEDAVAGTEKQISEAGAKVIRLPVSIPAHSPLMQSATTRVKDAISGLHIKDTVVPMVSNASGQLIHKANDLKDHLPNQLTMPVRWSQGIDFLHGKGVTEFIEIGPKAVLSGMVRRHLREKTDILVIKAEDVPDN